MIRGPLVEQAREQRARLATTEEEQERARMLSEYEALRAILIDLKGSRSYKLMRRLGRWGSIARGMRRARLE